jgi:hypothetical protein
MSGELERAWDQPDDDHAGFFLSRALRGFEFGLQRVLDGIAVYIERRSARR